MKLDEEIIAMHLMINALPPEVSVILNDQLTRIIKSAKEIFTESKDEVQSDLDDIRLAILNMKFDLDATKSERDEYKKLLDL